MGYSHYYRRRRTIPRRAFERIQHDFGHLRGLWRGNGVILAGPLGKGQPILTGEEIAFNGRIRCGHPVPGDVHAFAQMMKVASILALPDEQRADASQKLWDEEYACRRCPGHCACEPFWLPRVAPRDVAHTVADGIWQRTRTDYRPYDLAVTSALLIARHHLGPDLVICSDGGEAQWWEARLLTQSVLGYGFRVPLGLHDERPAAA